MSCTASDLVREPGWTIPYDVGIPSSGLYLIVLGTLWWMIVCGGIHIAYRELKISAPSTKDTIVRKFLKSKEFLYRCVFVIIYLAWGLPHMLRSCKACDSSKPDYCDNWAIMFVFGIVFIAVTGFSSTHYDFFLGEGLCYIDRVRFYFLNRELPTAEEIEARSQARVSEKMDADSRVGFWTLMPSTFITWVFAKSINNSAILGGMYGMRGGVAYASWYMAFIASGVLVYVLRTRYGFKSLPTAVFKVYGAPGALCFLLAVTFRLWTEVWSNATVIGSFYGAAGSNGYWGAAWVSTLIPGVYTYMGGMRASLYTDVVQAVLAVAFFVVVCIAIGADREFLDQSGGVFAWTPTTLYKTGSWYDKGWWACAVGGLIQGTCSYAFFDSCLTDRAFLSTPKTMLVSFVVGGVIAAAFIFFYAAIGVYAAYWHQYYLAECGCGSAHPVPTGLCPTDWNPCLRMSTDRGLPAYASYVLGHHTYHAVDVFVAITMITASISTVDSCFTSWSKLIALEWGGWIGLAGDKREVRGPLKPQDSENVSREHMMVARASIIFLSFISVCFLGVEKNAMAATDAAGSMVMGIGGPIWALAIWRVKGEGRKGWVQAPMAFVAPFAIGIVFGASYYMNGKDKAGWTYDKFLKQGDDWRFGNYYYSRFLGVNVVGHLICLGAFLLFFTFHQLFPRCWFYTLQPVEQEPDMQPAKQVEDADESPKKVAVSDEPPRADLTV